MPKKTVVQQGQAVSLTLDVPEGAGVKMTRNAEQWPQGPHTADVHIDEVENWSKHGWVVAEEQANADGSTEG